VAEHVNGKHLLPDSSSVELSSVKRGRGCWVVEVRGRNAATCPDCKTVSSSRHSNYWRHLKDLPLQGRAVQIRLRVGRWRCRNSVCPRQIFCERLPKVAGKHAQQTQRFGEIVQFIGYAVGGRPGERLGSRLGFPVSNDTLLRRVKQAARSRPPTKSVAVLGVDEWAWRKGYGRYGTILVDLKKRVVVDLLPDESAASFEQWLKEHPGVKIISRDRDGVYAEGASSGAPRAKQVADRFHLVQNLIKVVQEELAHQRHHLLMPSQQLAAGTATAEVTATGLERVSSQPPGPRPSSRQKETRQQRRQQKVALFEMVKSLRAQGMRAFEIVKATGISRGRVDKWLRLKECPPQNKMAPRPGMPDYYREDVRRLWDRGWRNGKKLLAEIRKLGYVGSYSGLVAMVAPWREEKRAVETAALAAGQPAAEPRVAMRHVSPQEAAALLSKPKPMLSERQRKIVEFLKQTGDFATMRHLVLSFRSILPGGKVASLKRWIEKAEASGIEGMRRFVRQLKKDMEAVENAVKEVWSNGPVEGHINRLKTLKRQMYGRAKFELLRARTLPLAA
jgi:transposase